MLKRRNYKYIPSGDLQKICIPIDQIKPLKDNPRKNGKTVMALVKIIKEIGFRRPIVLNSDGEIKAGNTAYKAALKLGMTHVPAVRTDFDTESDEWKCVLADNKISEMSEWDADALVKLFNSKVDFLEMSNVGFTEKELFEVKKLKKKHDPNVKNSMLGKLLNNLTKYEVSEDDFFKVSLRKQVNSHYMIAENGIKMAVLCFEDDQKIAKSRVKSGKIRRKIGTKKVKTQ